MKLFCRHKSLTAIARFVQNDERMVVLQCDKCGRYEVMPRLLMQQLRHTFVIDVDVSKINMQYIANKKEENNENRK